MQKTQPLTDCLLNVEICQPYIFHANAYIVFVSVGSGSQTSVCIRGTCFWDANLIVITYDKKGKKKDERFPFKDERNICSALFLDGTKHVRL